MSSVPTASTAPAADAPSRRGGPAPLWRRIGVQALFEARILLSNGEQLTVAVVLPALVLLGLHWLPVGGIAGTSRLDTAVAATFATAIVSTAFTSQAIQTGFDRRGGVLRWIATTPLGRGGYLAGKILATLGVQVVQALVLGILALILGFRATPGQVLAVIPVWVLGSVAFGALGLLVAGTLRTEAVLALSNILFIGFVTIGGIALPPETFPRLLRGAIDLTPSGALGDLMRAVLAGTAFSGGSLLVLALWAIGACLAVSRWFRWTSV